MATMAWWFGMSGDGSKSKWAAPFEAPTEKDAATALRVAHGPEFVAKGPSQSKWEAWHALQTWFASHYNET